MGYRIELWTEHEDNGAAIDALATRVSEDCLTLTAGEDVPKGEWVAFEVKLADGSVFLEGMGRCQGSTAKEPLFDVELGMLQLDTRDQMLFERILLAAEDLAAGARATGEVDISKLEEKAAKPPAPPTPAVPKKPAVPKPAVPKPPPPLKSKTERKGPPTLPPKDGAKKKDWPWQKSTEPGMPSPEPIAPPKPSTPKPSPPTPSPPTPSRPPPAVKSPIHADPPLPPILRQRLMNVVPTLVAEGRVRDLAGAHELALKIGLQALETVLEEED